LQPKLIKGGIHNDSRGELQFVNDCDLSDIKRFYRITHFDTTTIRAWQAHQREMKIFHCLSGSFMVHLIKIDDWENPSEDLQPISFTLSGTDSEVLLIPPGYANGFKALTPNSELLVFSNQTLTEAADDDFRFPNSMWVKW